MAKSPSGCRTASKPAEKRPPAYRRWPSWNGEKPGSDAACQIRQGDVLVYLHHDLLQADAGLDIDQQRRTQTRNDRRLAALFLLEQDLHHGHIIGGRRLQDGHFGIGQPQLVVEAERHRIDDLQCQRRIVQRLQRIAAGLCFVFLVHQHEPLVLLESDQAVREFNDLFRTHLDGTEQIGFYLHTLPPQSDWNIEPDHPTPTAHGCIFRPDCA